VQIGGTDQLFNIMTAARKLMEGLGARPNIAIIMGILPGTDGVVRMSKSVGNHIPLQTSAEDMYGKVMSVPDAAMGSFFRLVTRWTPAEISEIEQGLASGGLHPRDVKMRLAREIVEIYHGAERVGEAETAFRRVFQEGETPAEMAELAVPPSASATEVLLQLGWAGSRSAARRLVDQKAVWLGENQITSSDAPLQVAHPQVLRAGKRRFARLVPLSPR
jgi:tyrosyl-tRNA synthetase